MSIYQMSDMIFYLSLSLVVMFLLILIVALLRFYRRKSVVRHFTTVRGRVVIKGKVDYSGIRVTLGKLKSKEKVSVIPLVSSVGGMARLTTDKKGGFVFEDVPVGVHWIVVEATGYKTIIKSVRIEKLNENVLSDIVVK
ncbi:MAG: carboxypeptidase-like regulatory domain-containing protein [Candidatus Wallbacteria bacterium]|nr:carboxypeptidase-like regulatory domain-containing protein [Candidatus Wallbacteria bacterium]